MRHFRKTVLDVLDPAGAKDVFRIVRIGLPESRLVYPIGLVAYAVREAEGLEHFHRTAGDTVGLAFFHRARLLLDQDGLYVFKPGKLSRQRQARWAAADDEDVCLCGQRRSGLPRCPVGMNLRVAATKPVHMKLHRNPVDLLTQQPPMIGSGPEGVNLAVSSRSGFHRGGWYRSVIRPQAGHGHAVSNSGAGTGGS